MSDVRPFEEYKEMIKDMGKEEMIKGVYDLSARVTKQENIIKEVREYAGELRLYDNESIEFEISNDLFRILDKEKV